MRLATIRAAGELAVPFTSGILIGIGETRRERIEALLALRELHAEHGHIQEIIVQNFRAKPGTAMAGAPEPILEDLLWTIAVARLILPPEMSIQAPPNLNPGALDRAARRRHQRLGRHLAGDARPRQSRGAVAGPRAPAAGDRGGGQGAGRAAADLSALRPGAGALARTRHAQRRSSSTPMPRAMRARTAGSPARHRTPVAALAGRGRAERASCGRSSNRARAGRPLGEAEVVRLFAARGREVDVVCQAADALRQEVNGDRVAYVVNRNINYTNVCYFRCRFCAFSKGKLAENLRGPPYDLDLDEIARRAGEAWERGATEVCLQGGIHPDYTGETYLEICRAVKAAAPDIHVHAFSPLEVRQGAQTLGISLGEFLAELKAPGSAPCRAPRPRSSTTRSGA